MGPLYWVSASVLGVVFGALALDLRRQPTEGAAMRLFHWSISYVTLLFAAMAADQLLFH
jgi:protoheme IX farnesyltransferase